MLDPRMHRATLIAAVAMCLPFLAVLVWFGTPSSTAVLALSVFFVVAYSAPPVRWKEVPGLDSFTSLPGPLAALAVVPYIATVTPYRSVADADAESATRGWKRFLVLNQFAGSWITMVLIWWTFVR